MKVEKERKIHSAKKEAHNFLSLFSCMMVPQLSNYSNVHRHHQQRSYVYMMFFNVWNGNLGTVGRNGENILCSQNLLLHTLTLK